MRGGRAAFCHARGRPFLIPWLVPAALLLQVTAAGAAPAPAAGQERAAEPSEPSPGADDGSASAWSGRADVSIANSSGNSSSRSIGIKAEANREVRGYHLVLDGSLLRIQTDDVVREAVGSVDAFEVVRRHEPRETPDRARLRARASRNPWIGHPVQFVAALGWEHDAPAGIRSRYELTAGLGGRWGEERDDGRPPLALGAGLALVAQEDEVEDPELGAATLGLRFDGRSGMTVGSADLTIEAASTWNLRNRDDLRLDLTGTVAAPLTSRLALRTSVQTLLDTRPALERIPLFADPAGQPVGSVVAPRNRLDLILLVSFAVSW